MKETSFERNRIHLGAHFLYHIRKGKRVDCAYLYLDWKSPEKHSFENYEDELILVSQDTKLKVYVSFDWLKYVKFKSYKFIY